MKKLINCLLPTLVVCGMTACSSVPQYQDTASTQIASDSAVDVKSAPRATAVGAAAATGVPPMSSEKVGEAKVTPPAASEVLVDVRVTPILEELYGISVGYTGLVLEVHNRTGQDLTLNWDDTFYLQQGTPNGGFSLGGDKGGRLRGFDIIFAHETYVVTIYPTVLTNVGGIGTLTDPRLGNHKPMPRGEGGIAIKLRVGFEDASRRLAFTVPE